MISEETGLAKLFDVTLVSSEKERGPENVVTLTREGDLCDSERIWC